ncbi:MAG: redoxin domain-containing protein [Armatimonadota bacterium]
MPLRSGSDLPELSGATEWIGGSVRREDLLGSPTLIHFWSLSCYICKNNLPHLRAWKDTYAPQGLKVVAVHMPREEVETDVEKVRSAIAEHSIDEPCAIDNHHDIKDAFLNEAGYVPHYYLFDREGKLRARAAGDAGVAGIEAALAKLFAEETA